MSSENSKEGLNLSGVMPTFTVNDLNASIEWYEGILGFAVTNRMEWEGKLVGASLEAGGVKILLGQDDFAKGTDRQKGIACRIYCTTQQSIDELAARIKRRGGVLSQEPKDQPWGARDMAITDPDGFNISISTEISVN